MSEKEKEYNNYIQFDPLYHVKEWHNDWLFRYCEEQRKICRENMGLK
jgi:hypothetical protein